MAQGLRGTSPGLVHQVLIYPLTDARVGRTPSYAEFSEGHLMTRRHIEYFLKAYAVALRAAGVPAEYRCFAGQVHPFVLLAGLIDAAHDARRLMGERLREAFGG